MAASFLSKGRSTSFLSILIVELLIFNFCFYFSGDITHRLLNTLTRDHTGCHDDPYPDTFHRKPIYGTNFTYHVYAIKIGEILSRSLSSSEMQQYAHQISTDLLTNQYKIANHSAHKYTSMRDTYHMYYDDFHHDIKRVRCRNGHTPNRTFDFFQFIQFGAALQRTNETTFNFFNLAPTNFTFDDRAHIAPKLFSYTISVNANGDLQSLEFRFVEIVSLSQEHGVKHVLLNGMQDTLLWCGEFYYIFDHWFGQYVLIMDDASGHFKPNISLIPKYLEYILMKTLFPMYLNTTYRPLMLITRNMAPWSYVKPQLFPVVGTVIQRNKMINALAAVLKNAVLKNATCNGLVLKIADKMSGTSFNQSLRVIRNKLKSLNIVCKS